ncbi:MAG: ABC transporter permease [Bacteroidota bacterium]
MKDANKTNPPRLAKKIFRWFASEAWHDEILGDLEEQYSDYLHQHKKWLADLIFYYETILFLRPHIIKKRTKTRKVMLTRNNIKISYRNLVKNKTYSLINILGLALGLTTCLLIYLYVNYDTSYDDFQDENTYRMWINRVYPEREVNYPFVPHSFGPQLVEDFPEIEAQGRCFKPFNPTTVKVGDNYYIENNLIFADSTFLTILDFEMIQGNRETALNDPNSVVINQATANKLFGTESALGKSIEFSGSSKKVSGVVADYPANSHFSFDYLTAMHQLPFFNQINWVGFSAMTYLRLSDGTNPISLENKFPAFVKKYAEGPIQKRNGISYDEYIKSGNGYNYHLQKVKDIHLKSNLENELKANGNLNYIYIFSAIAIFILIIACINFMNLSTAKSTERGKEVGIRKVLGSEKKQLVSQFLTESIILTLISMIIALVATYLLLPEFANLAERPLSIIQLINPASITAMILIVLVTGLLAGLYPAIFISSFKPLAVLKGKFKNSKTGSNLRNGLVVLQFAISIALISATMIVFSQMDYLLNKPIGFNKENVIVIENINEIATNQDISRFETFKTEINKLPNIISSGYTSNMPGDQVADFVARVPGTDQKESMIMRRMIFDDQIQQTLDIKLLDGRFFSRNFNDSLSIIMNRSAIEKLGLTNPIGRKIQEINANNEPIEYTIVGVVDDFHFQSLHVDLKPAAFTYLNGPNGFISKMAVKIDGSDQGAIQQLENTWNNFVAGTPFKSYYLKTNMEQFYKAEKATGKIFGVFTFLAILIACIGLLGLSAFIINQRVKEIGVRKVLGASIFQLLTLLSKDFVKLIAISAVISIPASYLLMSRWLENFAYSIEINWSVFVIAGLAAITIGITVVCLQTVKAAISNPIDSLRDE